MMKNKIAILGGNSHIAKGLIFNFLSNTSCFLTIFTRNPEPVTTFIVELNEITNGSYEIITGYKQFNNKDYDVIINCVGAGTPAKLKNDFSKWFTVTEKYDNIVLDYLRKSPETLYVNFSSGAIYGTVADMPANANTVNSIKPNAVQVSDYYSIVRLNSEAKHRSFTSLKIVDLRIFAYFSRFIDINSGYLITELLKAVIDGTKFSTSNINIIRDYIHPNDLFDLIQKCIKQEKINTAIDVISREPVDKWRLIEFFKEEYNLEYEIEESIDTSSPNGSRNIYCSEYNTYDKIGYTPSSTAFDAVVSEVELLLKNEGSNHRD